PDMYEPRSGAIHASSCRRQQASRLMFQPPPSIPKPAVNRMPPTEPSKEERDVFQMIGTRERWTGGLPPLQPLPRWTTATRTASSAAAREPGFAGTMGGLVAA